MFSILPDEFLSGFAEPYSNRAAITHHEHELPHNDFRRAHDDHRGTHDDWRRSHYDFRMTFISRVLVTVAFRNKTSASSEEADDTG